MGGKQRLPARAPSAAERMVGLSPSRIISPTAPHSWIPLCQVNLKGTLLPLPRNAHGRPTVNDILKDYEAAVAKEVPEGEQQDPQVGGAAGGIRWGVHWVAGVQPQRHWCLQVLDVTLPKSSNGLPELSPCPAHPTTPQKAEAVREMVAGLRAYFDQALRHCLLYSHEVQQADEALRGGGGSSGAAPAAAESTAAGG